MKNTAKPKRSKVTVIIILILVALLAAGGGIAGFLAGSAQKTYEAALTALDGGFAALSAGDEAIEKLQGNPFGAGRIEAIRARQTEITAAEIQRLIDADELDSAEAILNGAAVPEKETFANAIAVRRQEIADADAYAAADALEASGDEIGALTAFVALGSYADAAQRAAAIQVRLDYANAEAVFTGENYEEGIAALRALGTAQGDEAADRLEATYLAVLAEQKEALRLSIIEAAQGKLKAGLWYTAGFADAPMLSGDARYPAAPRQADAVFSGFAGVFWIKDGSIVGYNDAFGGRDKLEAMTDIKTMAVGLNHAVVVHQNGRAEGIGCNVAGQIEFGRLNHIESAAAGAWHTVVLQQSGHVDAVGSNDRGQCDVQSWNDVTAIAAGLWHTVALKNDGTVLATGDNTYGQCDVQDWTDIIAIDCGACTTVGLRKDGTVVFAGDNAAGQGNVSDWTEIAAVAAGAYHTAAVRLDGTVLYAGIDTCGQTAFADKLFTNEWVCETACESHIMADGVATAYIEGEGSERGPWLYCGRDGAAMIIIDESEAKQPFRADLFAVSTALPGGRVTDPEASGKVIRMSTALPEEQARAAKAVIGFTGDYLAYTSNRKGVMMRNGIVYYDRSETTTLAILPDGTLKIYNAGEITAQQLLDMGVRDSFSFGPVLVNDGQAAMPKRVEQGVYTMRVGFGYTDPYHYVVGVAMRDRLQQMTLTELSELFVRYGCRVAYNFDGGHSTSLVFMGKELSMLTLRDTPHSNIRALSDILVFMTDERVGN